MADLYKDLKTALTEFKGFLDTGANTLGPVIKAVEQVVPQLSGLVTDLITLMEKIKTEIQNLNVSGIKGLDQIAKFTAAITAVLTTAKSLLPDDAAAIQKVLDVTGVVTGLPSVDSVKKDITDLIDAIVVDLNKLK
jgi:hypothetical protein